MNRPGRQNHDPQHDLRTAVAAMEGELSRLSTAPAGEAERTRIKALLASWATLVPLLGLLPAAQRRDCPVCGNSVMRAATLCSQCWSKLTPALAAVE